jgi:uncharacterized protein YjiS (DUF1127 family)
MTTLTAATESNKDHLISSNSHFGASFDTAKKLQDLTTRLMSSFFKTLTTWNKRYQGRQQLAQIEPHRLSDIGMNPSQVSREIAKPFWVK